MKNLRTLLAASLVALSLPAATAAQQAPPGPPPSPSPPLVEAHAASDMTSNPMMIQLSDFFIAISFSLICCWKLTPFNSQ